MIVSLEKTMPRNQKAYLPPPKKTELICVTPLSLNKVSASLHRQSDIRLWSTERLKDRDQVYKELEYCLGTAGKEKSAITNI